ncbi:MULTISPECIES: neutral/alkaline non-lysosomal ceramidase N-terminal domain-containing protein [Arenibacter]|uniref:neutral/alkaline non-lysosomal ceramidase N-terminal domain-containing protein n=1 Tax=Arenibacter TaxID=178469 RepID=UPI00196657C9|nr:MULTISPECIES: neutral/alkaline non-lysosomal ceramidase N-terminal domain-containing protein [Arenibacter]
MASLKIKLSLAQPNPKKFFSGHSRICSISYLITIFFLLISFQSMAGNSFVQDELLVRPESNGSLRLNAEKGKAIGPEIKYMPEWKAFGWFTAKDRVEWNVLVIKSGEYEVFLEWSVSDIEAGKPFVFMAGDKALKNKVTKSGSWETFKSKKIGSVQLSAGRQLMVFKPDSKFKEGALLDLKEIRLVPKETNVGAQKATTGHEFRAAVVKKSITPSDSQYLLGYGERKSESVHDSIFHRIVAMDDGTKQFFIVSTDICLFSPSEYDKVADRLQKQHGINPIDVWWTVTHTHSAPEVGVPGIYGTYMGERIQHEIDPAYTAMVEKKLIDGILEARKNLEPARLGVGWGFSQANINRRALDIDGKASLGMNPDGAVDRRIGLMRIDREDGSPLALISNYAIHGTVLGHGNLKISGDAPGIVSEYVEQKIGAPVLFINGAAGNLAPIYSTYPTPGSGHLGQFRVLLGDKIIEANRRILSTTNKVKLNSGAMVVETPRKPNLGWPSDLGNYTRTTDDGLNIVRLPIRFLNINDDVAIWSAPLELFNEISNEIRDRSPFPFTFYFGYTNGWLGYLPTTSAWQHGGYEVETVSPFTSTAETELKEAVLGYLLGL